MANSVRMMSLSPWICMILSGTTAFAGWEMITLPDLSSGWDLDGGCHFTSSKQGWAAGYSASGSGVLVNYSDGEWQLPNSPIPPNIGTDRWRLNGVHFTSSNEGWAVGYSWDQNNEGVILHYADGVWTGINLPYLGTVGTPLADVFFTSPTEGWAVGTLVVQGVGTKGLVLRYSNGTWASSPLPNIASAWGLNGVHFASPDDGWAVGWIHNSSEYKNSGMLLHYSNGSWTNVPSPPYVSNETWELEGVHFTSPNEGWAVGWGPISAYDNRGILLHYSNGSWSPVRPPDVSSSWTLFGVHFTASNEGWAVGGSKGGGILLHHLNGAWTVDTSVNLDSVFPRKVRFVSPYEGCASGGGYLGGLLLKYSIPENISSPTILTGPVSGKLGISYTYSTGGSSSNIDHPVQYLFDWGDGTNSGWLPIGVVSASKIWGSTGTYHVKVQAQCNTDVAVISSFSEPLTVTIWTPSINLESPSDSALYDSNSLISNYQPSFRWTSIGTFRSFTILFSTVSIDFMSKGIALWKAKMQAMNTSYTPGIATWKKIMKSSYNGGDIRAIYWKITGITEDNTLIESEVRSLGVESPRSVTIIAPEDQVIVSAPATFEFSSNGNIRFSLEFSSQDSFNDQKSIKRFSLAIKDPNDEQAVVHTLRSSEWHAVAKLVGLTRGYFRIKAWDGINRESTSELRSFSLMVDKFKYVRTIARDDKIAELASDGFNLILLYSDWPTDTVGMMDLKGNIIRTFDTPSPFNCGIAFDGKNILFTGGQNRYSGFLYAMSPSDGSISGPLTQIVWPGHEESQPYLAFDGGNILASGPAAGIVGGITIPITRLNALDYGQSESVSVTIDAGPPYNGSSVSRSIITWSNGSLYAALGIAGLGKIYRFDSNLNFIGEISISKIGESHGIGAVTFLRDSLFVLNRSTGEVYQYIAVP